MYSDFDFYTNTYLGKDISSEEYPKLSRLASTFINAELPRGAVPPPYPLELQNCECEIIEALNSNSLNIKSESSGSYSVTYNRVLEDNITQIISRNLANSNLICCWF